MVKTMNKLKVMSVFGTRPEAIKMAPLVLELTRREELQSIVCVTAQHREMLDGVMESFGIQAEHDLDIMRPGQSLESVTARVLEGMGEVLRIERPDLVLVHGDTTTTFAGALAAFYAKIPVGHVEAGLRTFDRYSPFPEELNRLMVARLANYHFAPTRLNAENLKREGIDTGVFVTGNTVVDAMRYTISEDGEFKTPELQAIDFEGRRVVAMTCHRRENYGEPMENIFTAVRRLAQEFPEALFVYPVHPAPAVRETAERMLTGVDNIELIEPLEATEMHRLLARCYMVMTDSGGLQEEAPAVGKPVLVLRGETERPEAVDAGCVALAGTETERVYELGRELLLGGETYERMAHSVSPYGDGHAAERIADAILWSFGLSGAAPGSFEP